MIRRLRAAALAFGLAACGSHKAATELVDCTAPDQVPVTCRDGASSVADGALQAIYHSQTVQVGENGSISDVIVRHMMFSSEATTRAGVLELLDNRLGPHQHGKPPRAFPSWPLDVDYWRPTDEGMWVLDATGVSWYSAPFGAKSPPDFGDAKGEMPAAPHDAETWKALGRYLIAR